MFQQKYAFVLTGTTPLLMHNDNLDASDNLKAWIKAPENKGKSEAGDDRTPAWTWKGCCYTDGTHLTVPEDNVRACLTAGATKVIKRSPETFKKYISSGIMFPAPYLTLLINGKQLPVNKIEAIEGVYREQCQAAKALGFRLLAKRATVGTSKHVRVRPQFDSWSVSGEIIVLDSMFTLDILKTIFAQSGFYVGLCDWRPGAPKKPGPFGKFTAEVKDA